MRDPPGCPVQNAEGRQEVRDPPGRPVQNAEGCQEVRDPPGTPCAECRPPGHGGPSAVRSQTDRRIHLHLLRVSPGTDSASSEGELQFRRSCLLRWWVVSALHISNTEIRTNRTNDFGSRVRFLFAPLNFFALDFRQFDKFIFSPTSMKAHQDKNM